MEREYEHGEAEAEAGDPRTVIISLSGRQHRTRLAGLRLYPDSRLGRISLAASLEEVRALCDGFVPGRVPVLYFDRNPQHFGECLLCAGCAVQCTVGDAFTEHGVIGKMLCVKKYLQLHQF